MPIRMTERNQRPLLDIASYGRRGPHGHGAFTPAEREHISRTVGRVPEVMVKVSGGGKSSGQVAAHFRYVDRNGTLEMETDDGERLSGRGIANGLVTDWDLELEGTKPPPGKLRTSTKQPKLAHNIIFSMPPGTPPDKLLAAVRTFAREEWALKHRFMMALHTDEPHPHVHVVVKAMSEQGKRLNPNPTALRAWRAQFARHLRAQGIAANATERSVRGVSRSHHHDGIYRAMRRGASTFYRQRTREVVTEIAKGGLKTEPGKAQLLGTRQEIVRGWQAVAQTLARDGQQDLARRVVDFVCQMLPARTDKEHLSVDLIEHHRRQSVRERDRTR